MHVLQGIHHAPKKKKKNQEKKMRYTAPAQTNCASVSVKAVVSYFFFVVGQLDKANLVNVPLLI